MFGVARIADVAEHPSGLDAQPRFHIGVAVEVGVIMALAARPHHPYHQAAEAVGADLRNDAFGGGQHRRAALGENVDALVRAAFGARGIPGIAQRARADAFHRDRQHRWLGHRSQAQRIQRPLDGRPQENIRQEQNNRDDDNP
jgi:hypothetical protein